MRALCFLVAIASIPFVCGPALAQWGPAQTVDNSGDVGYTTSIAYDTDGHPHIAYATSTSALKYAYWDPQGWHIEALSDYGRFPSLALDSGGNPHIAVMSGTALRMVYWSRAGGVWGYVYIPAGASGYQTGANPAIATGGQRVSLVLDGDNPNVAYWGSDNQSLIYTYKSGASWPVIAVDTGVNLGQYASMAIDAAHTVYIAYYDGGGGDLKFAHKHQADVAFALASPLDGTGIDVGSYCSLVLDTGGVPHISYYDATNRQLKHAWITNLP
jgi:hypothetical protein